MTSKMPVYRGTLRSHSIDIPESIYKCSGISIFGKRIKSLVFSTDVAIIKNINANAIIAVYPFTPQPSITKALISVSDVPVFVGVGGGLTSGKRSVRMAEEAENDGAYGVVVNVPVTPDVIKEIKSSIEIPVIATVVSSKQDIKEKIDAGVDILNVAASTETPKLVKLIREKYPKIPIIATGGSKDDDILKTIEAGANAISFTPPSTSELLSKIMVHYRKNL